MNEHSDNAAMDCQGEIATIRLLHALTDRSSVDAFGQAGAGKR
jgi:hypothetical protein